MMSKILEKILALKPEEEGAAPEPLPKAKPKQKRRKRSPNGTRRPKIHKVKPFARPWRDFIPLRDYVWPSQIDRVLLRCVPGQWHGLRALRGHARSEPSDPMWFHVRNMLRRGWLRRAPNPHWRGPGTQGNQYKKGEPQYVYTLTELGEARQQFLALLR